MRTSLIPLLAAAMCCCWIGAVRGQDVSPAPANDDVPVLQYPSNPVTDILALYEKLTGKVLIRDATLNSASPLSLVTTKPMSKEQAIHFIEGTLLLNGFSLVPDGENREKVIYTPVTGKNPRSEGVPLFDNPTAMPTDNQVVSYFMQLRYIASADALAIFKEHVVLHSYGAMIEVPNSQAILITENTPLIRELINLQELVDVPPARMDSEFITLKHADAERVAETINRLIDAGKNDKQKGAAPAPGNPATGAAGESSENDLVTGSVQLIPDARTNRILVIARPASFPYIKNLISQFDEEIGSFAPLERPLKYVSASEVLPALADALQETEGGKEGQAGSVQIPQAPRSTQQQQSQQQNTNNAAGDNGTSGVTEPQDILPEPEDEGPTSVIVGKTHLIADNKANSILVIGPPESQEKVREILDKLDRRPPQVYLSTVIGQLQLVNNNETGVDYLKLFQSAGSASGNNNGYAGSVMNTTTSLITPQNLTTAAAFPATGGLSLYGTIGKNLSVYVHALEANNRFKVLARPVVYTANNKKAVILSGQKVPIPTQTLSNLVPTANNNNTTALQSNINYEDVVLKLEVIPLINANNEVNLKIAQVDDSLAGTQLISGNNIPTISTQKIVTTVTVPNGDTVVLGGLITETTTNNLTGIPILMHLPWIGPAFRDTVKNKERDELIIFIQPNVVDSNQDIVAASEGEKDKAETGKDAYLFSQPAVLPAEQMDSFFPKDSKEPGK